MWVRVKAKGLSNYIKSKIRQGLNVFVYPLGLEPKSSSRQKTS